MTINRIEDLGGFLTACFENNQNKKQT